jgi:hypothetical protein
MYVQHYIVACSVTIVTMETQQYVPSLLVAGIDIVVNNINVFSTTMETSMDSFCTLIDLQNIAYNNNMKYYRSVSLYLP